MIKFAIATVLFVLLQSGLLAKTGTLELDEKAVLIHFSRGSHFGGATTFYYKNNKALLLEWDGGDVPNWTEKRLTKTRLIDLFVKLTDLEVFAWQDFKGGDAYNVYDSMHWNAYIYFDEDIEYSAKGYHHTPESFEEAWEVIYSLMKNP